MTLSQQSLRYFVRRTWSLWCLHLVALACILAWALIDLRFESMLVALQMSATDPRSAFQTAVKHVGIVRPVLFLTLLVVAAATLVALIGNRFRSSQSPQSRSIRSLLAIALIVSMWCSVAINASFIAWQGNRIRVGMQFDQLEAIAQPLRKDWPTRDGDIPGVGPFMAYPFGRPTVLVLLASPRIAGDGLSIAAIERSDLGAIKLQLSGTDHDDWAEWHPPGSYPATFTGGLSDQHELVSVSKLGNRWSLVRYRS